MSKGRCSMLKISKTWVLKAPEAALAPEDIRNDACSRMCGWLGTMCACWGLNLGPLQEQVLLTTKPSPNPCFLTSSPTPAFKTS